MMRSLLTVASGLMLLGNGVLATDFFTTNSSCLAHFWAAAESTNRPVTVISFGDSMADSYRSATYHLMNKFQARLGVAGYSLNNYQNAALVNFTNGGYFYTPPPELWYHWLLAVPAGAALWWEKQYTTGVYADQVGLFWITQPQGGPMRFLISTNGAPWSTVLTLEGQSATPVGCYTNLQLAPDFYRVRVETDAGTNYILGNQALLRASPGLHAVFMDFPGIDLGGVTNVLPQIRDLFFAALKPDLLIWHMKEPEDLSTSNRMEQLERSWQAIVPNLDILYIGTTWTIFDTTNWDTSSTPTQNTIVRNIALRHHRAYVDLMQPNISYQWQLTNGFMIVSDGVHLTTAGGLHCANIMWDDLGFFALDLNRSLQLSHDGAEYQLQYDTDARATYRLEASANLTDWAVLTTNPVANATFTTNFPPPDSPKFYRLGLTPNP